MIELLDEVNSDDEGEELDDLSVQTFKTVQSGGSAVSATSNNSITPTGDVLVASSFGDRRPSISAAMISWGENST